MTVVLLIQVVGLILVLALLILPAATAAQFAGASVLRMMLLAVAISTLMTIAGLLLSYAHDLPSGSTIIILAGSVYFVTLYVQYLARKLLWR